mmetsp:Transcript_15500/g.31351  ORF Transcript_15500/g.31351 Transcript_15500/m.31351 type:complete len:89 (+) Transcript_15500:84-350(+)
MYVHWAFGVAGGLAVAVLSNASRKLPLSHHPWEHLIAMGVGGCAVYKAEQFKEWASGEISRKQAVIEERERALRDAKERALNPTSDGA